MVNKKRTSILVIAIAISTSLFILASKDVDAMCVLDQDWPAKPCYDTYPPLPLTMSEWQQLWNDYYEFKGKDWMEQKKLEMDGAIKSDTLTEWIESGYGSQNFTNYNVWFYYYVNDMSPAPLGYELNEISNDEEILSPLKQFKSGISIQDIKCKESFQLVIKARDGSPACVKPTSVQRLFDRGWAISIDSIDNPEIPPPETEGILVTLLEGQREGPLLVQKIFQDSVSGLNFPDYPVPRDTGFPITLQLGDSASNGCTLELTLVRISGNAATFLKKEYNDRPCPICLSEDTVIDTPNGAFTVKQLKEGMTVFTQDTSGHKYIGTILETGKTMVPPNHKMVHIILADNRELHVSPNHLTADGRLFGELLIGDTLDGSKIKISELVLYNGTYTYDILPSDQTGFYWANGILIKSTLK